MLTALSIHLLESRKHFCRVLTRFAERFSAYAFFFLISFIFSYLESFFVVFYSSFYFYRWGPRFLQACTDSGEDVLEGG